MSGSIGTISLITQVGEFENKYFINNPDITFFKSVYRKHTNFTKYLKRDKHEYSFITRDGMPNPISKKIITGSGDLLSKIYLENKFKFKKSGDVSSIKISNNLGSNIISSDEGSLSIDISSNKGVFKSSGLFQEIKGELDNQYTGTPYLECTDKFISCKNGSHYNYTTLSGGVGGMVLGDTCFADLDSVIETEYFYTIPEFSFMKDYGLSLPLLSLRNDDIFFKVKYQTFENIFKDNSGVDITFESNIIQEIIELDIAEKSRFLTSQLTYLTENITQILIDSTEKMAYNMTGTIKLCKYLFLVGDPEENSSTPTELKFKTLNITLDGNSIWEGGGVSKEIFTKLNINKYFIGCGREILDGDPGNIKLGQMGSIAMVPFSIEPLNYTQPSGCISTLGNSSRFNLNLHPDSTNSLGNVVLFTINYNILQISDGKSQLQYS